MGRPRVTLVERSYLQLVASFFSTCTWAVSLSVSFLQHRYQATWSSMLYDYRPRSKEVLSFTSRELMKGAAWPGMAWHIPCSMFQNPDQDGREVTLPSIVQALGIHRMQMPHVASSDIQSNLNTYLPTTGVTAENFFFSNPSLNKRVTFRAETRGWRWPRRTVSLVLQAMLRLSPHVCT